MTRPKDPNQINGQSNGK